MIGEKIALVLPDFRPGGADWVAIRLLRHFMLAGHYVEFVLIRNGGELLAQLPPVVSFIDLGVARIRNAVRSLIRNSGAVDGEARLKVESIDASG